MSSPSDSVTLAEIFTENELTMSPTAAVESGGEIVRSKKILPGSKTNGTTHIEEKKHQSYNESYDQTTTRGV